MIYRSLALQIRGYGSSLFLKIQVVIGFKRVSLHFNQTKTFKLIKDAFLFLNGLNILDIKKMFFFILLIVY